MPTEKKSTYLIELRARVAEFIEREYTGEPPADDEVEVSSVKEVALESYKNGLAAGRRNSSARVDARRESGGSFH